MPITISDEVAKYIPNDAYVAITSRYGSDTKHMYNLRNVRVFHTWCKTYCSVDILIQYILRDNAFSLDIRRAITSHILNRRHKIEKMTESEYLSVTTILGEQIEERKVIAKNRTRRYKEIDSSVMGSKRMKTSMISLASSTYCTHTQSSTLSVDIISHILEYLNIDDVWSVRGVSRCFYNGYCSSQFKIVFTELSVHSLTRVLYKIIQYNVDALSMGDSASMQILNDTYKYHTAGVEFRNSGKHSLYCNKIRHILDQAIPIINRIKDRIHIDTLITCIDKESVRVVDSLVERFLSQVGYERIREGIVINYDTNAAYRLIGSIIELLQQSTAITSIEFRNVSVTFTHVINRMSVLNVVLPHIKRVIIVGIQCDLVMYSYIEDMSLYNKVFPEATISDTYID